MRHVDSSVFTVGCALCFRTSALTRIEPWPLHRSRCRSHWTTREVPRCPHLNHCPLGLGPTGEVGQRGLSACGRWEALGGRALAPPCGLAWLGCCHCPEAAHDLYCMGHCGYQPSEFPPAPLPCLLPGAACRPVVPTSTGRQGLAGLFTAVPSCPHLALSRLQAKLPSEPADGPEQRRPLGGPREH